MTETRLRVTNVRRAKYNNRPCVIFDVHERVGQAYLFRGSFSMLWEGYRLPPEHTCIGWYFEEMENAALAN